MRSGLCQTLDLRSFGLALFGFLAGHWPLIARDKITPLPLKHLSFQVSVQGTCSFKPVDGLVALLGPA